MVESHNLNQLTRIVEAASRIVVTSHANCGDATGSVVAVTRMLRARGKFVLPVLPAPVPKVFRFLANTEEIGLASEVNLQGFDLLLCVDAAEPWMTGLAQQLSTPPQGLTVVNFDHHLTNPGYGDVNVLDKGAAATCAMLYEWFRSAGWSIDRESATALVTGIFIDTGTFSNPATNPAALATASDLLLRGANVPRILREVARNRTLAELKLWGRAFERLREHPTLGIVSTVVTLADMAEFGVESLEGVANFLNELAGYRAVLVLKEQPDGTVKGSLRTTREDVDVAAVAKLFGGGGHRKAAGFSLSGKLVETAQGWKVDEPIKLNLS